ncbi:MAG: TolC family protein [Gemmataceae bacterium]
MRRWLLLALTAAVACGCASGELRRTILQNAILPEQRTIDALDPAQLPPARIPETVPPRTVADSRPETPELQLSLDDAIRIALENARVVRILAGTSAVSSGQTIYDAAITNNTIDTAQARFDPTFTHSSTWTGNNTPLGVLNPADPTQVLITSVPTNSYTSNLGLSKTNVLGGQWQATWIENPTWFPGVFGRPLNPQTSNSFLLSYSQPLLQGAGFRVNTAPIVIARLNTATSYFQYKDSVQEMVRGVITAYWNLVQARTDAWSRSIQVQLSKETYERDEARLKLKMIDAATAAQSKVSYTQFRAAQIAADAAVIRQEGALRNILGLPPDDDHKIVPVSAPTNQRLQHNWNAIVRLAEQRRPDIIELKIVTEADSVRLMVSENQVLPQLNAATSYQWNGLSGIMPNGQPIGAGGFGNWSAGINFSVPLGLRAGRAQVRQAKLVIARDEANIEQALHAAIHDLAGTIRDLDSAFEQYEAFKKAREAAEVNVEAQYAKYKKAEGLGGIIFLNVLQALNDWGFAVTSESQQLLAYNTLLATLERQTGTILETHGLVFAEERTRAAGPLLVPCRDRDYPSAIITTGAPQRYPSSGAPSEDALDLQNPALPDGKRREQLPPPTPVKP